MADNIFIEFKDVFKRVQDSTQLKAKGTGIADIVLSDSYESTALTFFSDGVDLLKQHGLHYLEIKNYDSTVKIELNESLTSGKFKSDKGLVEKCLSEYILYQWYRNINQSELANEAYSLHDMYQNDLLMLSSNKNYARPTPRVYY